MSRCFICVVAAIVAFAGVLAGSARTQAAELVMFERQGCPYCESFNREIAPIWPRTELGQRAPLRRVDIHSELPSDLHAIVVERITPVFVVVDRGREVGRIRGYPGEDNFWGLVTGLINELPANATSSVNK
jgi:thioredoxin-related protein